MCSSQAPLPLWHAQFTRGVGWGGVSCWACAVHRHTVLEGVSSSPGCRVLRASLLQTRWSFACSTVAHGSRLTAHLLLGGPVPGRPRDWGPQSLTQFLQTSLPMTGAGSCARFCQTARSPRRNPVCASERQLLPAEAFPAGQLSGPPTRKPTVAGGACPLRLLLGRGFLLGTHTWCHSGGTDCGGAELAVSCIS